MEIRVKFAGGPQDGFTAMVDKLDPQKVFFTDEDRRVLVYFRADELLYVYDHVKSTKLSEDFDASKAAILAKFDPSTIRWEEPPGEELS